MIQPAPGVAFTWSDDGDARADVDVRRRVSSSLGISPEWATTRQVHGSTTHSVVKSGACGDGDALVTGIAGVPLAVFTADCLGVVFTGEGAVAVAHAGWRGLAAGVLDEALGAMADVGAQATHVYLGPAIGPCCFEVGPEVAEVFAADLATTTWGTTSVDLVAAAKRRLDTVSVWVDGRCTACGGGHSHRRDATDKRMAAIGWLS